jgi:hypothetical protein
MIEFQALILFYAELRNYLSDLKSFSSLHGSSSYLFISFAKLQYTKL